MHEVSLAGSILKLVEGAAMREGFVRVRELRLEVGKLAQVELHALRFALEAIAAGTLLEGAIVVFDMPEGAAWCPHCCATVAYSERGQPCPTCGGYDLKPTAGMEFRVKDMLVADN